MKNNIDEEILQASKELAKLKTFRKELVETIKNQVYWLGDTQNLHRKCQAALHYSLQIPVRGWSDVITVREPWGAIKVGCIANLDCHKSSSGTPATFIFELKDLKHVVDWDRMWMKSVECRETKLSQEEWKNYILKDNNKFMDVVNTFYRGRFQIVNCKELKLKNFAIIYPAVGHLTTTY